MTTTSIATALVACDHTLGNDPELAKYTCVLTVARGDGTPFYANSFQEEDIADMHRDGIGASQWHATVNGNGISHGISFQ